MKYIWKFLLTALSSVVLACMLWLLFKLVTSFVMSFEMTGLFIYVSFFGGLLVLSIGSFMTPATRLVSRMADFKLARILPSIIFAYFGYLSVLLPWQFYIEHDRVKLILAIFSSLFYGVTFISFICCFFIRRE